MLSEHCPYARRTWSKEDVSEAFSDNSRILEADVSRYCFDRNDNREVAWEVWFAHAW